MKYDVNYFIKKFTAIHSNKWCILNFTRGKQHCVLGHCKINSIHTINNQARALIQLFNDNSLFVLSVNDGGSILYPQNSPKKRVLAALQDIKKKATVSEANLGENGVNER